MTTTKIIYGFGGYAAHPEYSANNIRVYINIPDQYYDPTQRSDRVNAFDWWRQNFESLSFIEKRNRLFYQDTDGDCDVDINDTQIISVREDDGFMGQPVDPDVYINNDAFLLDIQKQMAREYYDLISRVETHDSTGTSYGEYAHNIIAGHGYDADIFYAFLKTVYRSENGIALSDQKITQLLVDIAQGDAYARTRLGDNETLSSSQIAQIHWDAMRELNIPVTAWYGTLFEEFVSTGSWAWDSFDNGDYQSLFNAREFIDDVASNATGLLTGVKAQDAFHATFGAMISDLNFITSGSVAMLGFDALVGAGISKTLRAIKFALDLGDFTGSHWLDALAIKTSITGYLDDIYPSSQAKYMDLLVSSVFVDVIDEINNEQGTVSYYDNFTEVAGMVNAWLAADAVVDSYNGNLLAENLHENVHEAAVALHEMNEAGHDSFMVHFLDEVIRQNPNMSSETGFDYQIIQETIVDTSKIYALGEKVYLSRYPNGLGHYGGENPDAPFNIPFAGLASSDVLAEVKEYFGATPDVLINSLGHLYGHIYSSTHVLDFLPFNEDILGSAANDPLEIYGLISGLINIEERLNELRNTKVYQIHDSRERVYFGGDEDNQVIYATDGGSDNLFLGNGNNRVDAAVNEDGIHVVTGAGTDEIIGGHGADEIYTGNNNDYIDAKDDDDSVHAGKGDDTLIGGNGDDYLDGGEDSDLVDYSQLASTLFVEVDLAAGTGEIHEPAALKYTDTLIDIENVRDTQNSDRILGNDIANNFYYTGGQDFYAGRDGNDKFYIETPQADEWVRIDGGDGEDRIYITGGDWSQFEYSTQMLASFVDGQVSEAKIYTNPVTGGKITLWNTEESPLENVIDFDLDKTHNTLDLRGSANHYTVDGYFGAGSSGASAGSSYGSNPHRGSDVVQRTTVTEKDGEETTIITYGNEPWRVWGQDTSKPELPPNIVADGDGSNVTVLIGGTNVLWVDSFFPLDDYAGQASWMNAALSQFQITANQGSPLVVDIDADGVELISLENTTLRWDIDEDGFAEACGWVAADDGLLAIDSNADGIVTDHTELFGSLTEDGFTALSVYDTNADSVIDANDAQFSDLLIWRDLNQNGYSEAGEMASLADYNITSINLNATQVSQTIAGNDISHVSTYTMDDGVNGPQTLDIVDAWFTYDDINTNYALDFELDPSVVILPMMRGYGSLPSLSVSMSLDNDFDNPESLLYKVADFAAKDFTDFFVEDGSVLSEVRDIMLRWANMDGVDPLGRGSNVDAREQGFIETFFDEVLYSGYNPGGLQGEQISKTFDFVLQTVSTRMIAQTAGSQLFEGDFSYNPATDEFEGITGINQTALDTLLAKAEDASQVSDKVAYWGDVVRVIERVVGVDNLSTGDAAALETAIVTSDDTLSTQQILDTLEWDSSVGTSVSGTSSADTLDGTVGDDTLYGGYGNDVINGGIGSDTLHGQGHNDTLNGQSGDDFLYGETGDDTYLYYAGQGHDTITEQSGNDRVLFGPGITYGDLIFTRIANNDLRIDVDQAVGGGSVTILNQFTSALVELLEFNDGSTFDLTTIGHTLVGTSGNDTLLGVRYGGTEQDVIYGMDGDDIIKGYYNVLDYTDNALYGGDGKDTIYGAYGVDTIDGGADDDIIKGSKGDDDLTGGLGDDELHGEFGADTYHYNYGDGHDTIIEGNDTSVDKIVFGSDITPDMISFERSSNYDVTINLYHGLGGSITLQNQTYSSAQLCVETLEFADGSTIDITAQDLTLLGTSGNDTLTGIQYGASINDTIYGFEGDDTITGYRSSQDYSDNWLYGGDGNDTIYGANGVDYIEGGNGNDTIRGYNGDDELHGGFGDDEILGGNNNDTLYGDAGADILKGDGGNDILTGGLGADELWGGTGYDTFTFLGGQSLDAVDTIKDFNAAYDAIDIADLLSAYDPLSDAITDFVQITDNGTDSTLSVDIDGGADSFTAIALIAGQTGLTDEAALETSGILIAA